MNMDDFLGTETAKLCLPFFDKIADILSAARNRAYDAINFAMVQAYWEINRSIVEEQGGEERAQYGSSSSLNFPPA